MASFLWTWPLTNNFFYQANAFKEVHYKSGCKPDEHNYVLWIISKCNVARNSLANCEWQTKFLPTARMVIGNCSTLPKYHLSHVSPWSTCQNVAILDTTTNLSTLAHRAPPLDLLPNPSTYFLFERDCFSCGWSLSTRPTKFFGGLFGIS